MIRLVFPGTELDVLASSCRETHLETFALVLARPVEVAPKSWRLLVISVHLAEQADCDIRTPTYVRPSAMFRLPLEKRARREGLSVIYCHSHPAQARPAFSATDRGTERALARYASERFGAHPHVALLIGAEGVAARELGTTAVVEVWQVGRRVQRAFPLARTSVAQRADRQVRAFGKEGQRRIQALRIAVVGCGGTGSIVTQELAYLGAADLLLIDPDRLTTTNLNRVVGALPADLRRPKVKIAARMVSQISPNTRVRAQKGDILEAEVGKLLLDVDLVFCCTDSEGSRYFLNQLAYQYYIPVIDMGVSISPRDGRVISMDGRVQMLAPRLRCLICLDGTLNAGRVRWDLQNARERQQDPYFNEVAGVKQPSVISLNGTIASQAVTLFLAAVAGVPIDARLISFRALRGDARVQDDQPQPDCVNCSESAYLGKGALYDLPERSH
jgi:molybdopterin-synthase adenylyltransferase